MNNVRLCARKLRGGLISPEVSGSSQVHLSITDGCFILNANGLRWDAQDFLAALEDNNCVNAHLSSPPQPVSCMSAKHTHNNKHGGSCKEEMTRYMRNGRQVLDPLHLSWLPSERREDSETHCPDTSALSRVIRFSVGLTHSVCVSVCVSPN